MLRWTAEANGMMTLRTFSSGLATIPAATGWLMADLGEALGKQALFIKQSPQKLKALREHALAANGSGRYCRKCRTPVRSSARAGYGGLVGDQQVNKGSTLK